MHPYSNDHFFHSFEQTICTKWSRCLYKGREPGKAEPSRFPCDVFRPGSDLWVPTCASAVREGLLGFGSGGGAAAAKSATNAFAAISAALRVAGFFSCNDAVVCARVYNSNCHLFVFLQGSL